MFNFCDVWLYFLIKHIAGRYLCSTVVSHTLLPKGSMRENKKHYMTKLESHRIKSNTVLPALINKST